LLYTGKLFTRLWRSGYAVDCKSTYSGSIPDGRSNHVFMVELVYTSASKADALDGLQVQALLDTPHG
jgi:hypothetical protein